MGCAKLQTEFRRFRSGIGAALIAAAITLASAIPARAQVSSLYPDFFSLRQPETFQLVLFGGGYVSDQSAVTQEGFQIEQSITPYIGVFGRAIGYQLFVGHGFGNPLIPDAGTSSRYNFGRFQGGLDLTVFPGAHLYLSGGHDAGDSHGSVIEGDFNSWMFAHSRLPLNLSFSSLHDTENGVTSNEIDLRTVVYSGEKYLLLAGAGGAFFAGGIVSGTAGQGGPDLTLFYRPLQIGAMTQFGYGSARQYGEISFFRQFSWNE
jgi:hypothetical protein